MKEQKSQHKIFKADPAKVEAYQLLGDDYDFNKDPLDAEGLTAKIQETLELIRKGEKNNG